MLKSFQKQCTPVFLFQHGVFNEECKMHRCVWIPKVSEHMQDHSESCLCVSWCTALQKEASSIKRNMHLKVRISAFIWFNAEEKGLTCLLTDSTPIIFNSLSSNRGIRNTCKYAQLSSLIEIRLMDRFHCINHSEWASVETSVYYHYNSLFISLLFLWCRDSRCRTKHGKAVHRHNSYLCINIWRGSN